jgi:hypothetical protein
MAFSSDKITDPNLPTVRIEANNQGGFTAIVEASGGDGRLFTYNPAGGHYELTLLHGFPEGNGQTLDGDGYIVPIKG